MSAPHEQAVVVFVHGLWNTGLESWLLRKRVTAALGARGCTFRYRSVRNDATTNIALLSKFVTGLSADTVHMVGHSLGGVLILRMLQQGLEQRSGRTVLLGPPLRGSAAARGLSRYGWGRALLGRSVAEALLDDSQPQWSGARDIGVIAGTGGVGLGQYFAQLDRPHDGTVAVSETLLDGARARVQIKATHSGMLFSKHLAKHCATFLTKGSFE